MAASPIKEPVRIRRKTLANGNISLYLAIYINGRREYEFQKLYLIPEKTKADKEWILPSQILSHIHAMSF